MADFKLDIDYPVEVVKKESLEIKPERIPYSQHNVRFRHYGRFIQDSIRIAIDYPEGEERKRLLQLIANHMKMDYQNWNNKDGMEDQKILDDLCELSGGKIRLSVGDITLTEQRIFPRRRQMKMNNNNQQKKKY